MRLPNLVSVAEVMSLRPHLDDRKVLKLMLGLVGPVISREREVGVDPCDVPPVRRQALDSQVDGILFEPQGIIGSELQMARVVGACNGELAFAERNLDRKEDRP
jgi:hypothetical protein